MSIRFNIYFMSQKPDVVIVNYFQMKNSHQFPKIEMEIGNKAKYYN